MVEYENIRFTVLSVEERRIGKVRVEVLPRKEKQEDDAEQDEKEHHHLLHERESDMEDTEA